MEKIADFLERHELSGTQLSRMLGYTGAEAVNARRRNDEDIPEAWLPKLAELGLDVEGAGASFIPPPDAFRDDEREPVAPEGAPRAPQELPAIDYATVSGYIEGTYKLVAQMGVRPADPLLADVIDEHAAAAGKAWAHWIESEPKVAALLQRMMIGTPLGEVIGVHVAIVFSYTIARSAIRSAERDARLTEAAADGTAAAAAEDSVAAA